jgi:hypothetical protein
MTTHGVDDDSQPIRISVFEFTKADLAGLPAEDRRLMILAGHALNLLGVWVKLLAATTNCRTPDGLIDPFNAAQSQILIRTLCGTLVEVWRWINTAEVSHSVRKRYKDDMPSEAVGAYGRLGKHFGSGLFHKARNAFAFHFPNSETLDNAFASTPDNQDLNWYLSRENTNSLYFGCEAIIGHGLYDLASEEVRGRAGIDRLLPELFEASNDVADFLGGLLTAIVGRHLAHCPRSEFQAFGAPGPRHKMPFLLDRVFG